MLVTNPIDQLHNWHRHYFQQIHQIRYSLLYIISYRIRYSVSAQ